ncbi:hypothetical protein JTE90_028077 [Oedothorax gibbosus]|uniref:Probable arginine--tRNA ligase, mitochondrial n=1 Tax=Oedothorax gibbosus TaxID=931172 RepID=A0AAV6VA19_9ARAC|nr:hypothetical protein JTE90_028077 [Oedothorax gibbosus]
MASFFRWRIANKLLPVLVKGNTESKINANSISSIVKVSRLRGVATQLFVPWKRVTNLLQTENLTNPADLVTRLRNQGLPTAEGFTDITLNQEPLGIFFTVDKHVFSKIVLTDICSEEENGIRSSCLFQDIPRKNLIVQCQVPKIGETFQMTHFRSAIHCNFISNINKLVGHTVVKVRHIADGGLQSAILMTGYKEFGNENDLLENPSTHLSKLFKAGSEQYRNDFKFKDKVDICLRNMEKGDKAVLRDWHYLTNIALKHQDTIYNTIGLTFDDSHFDSSYSSEIKEIKNDLLEKNIACKKGNENLKFNVSLDSKKGAPAKYSDADTFLLNLSSAIFYCVNSKNKYNFDAMLYVAPTSQKYFLSLLPVLIKQLGFEWSENFQHIELQDIKHFERNKKYFDTERVLKQAKRDILFKFKSELNLYVDENLDNMAEVLGLSSLVIHDMKNRRKIDYAFEWKDMLSFGRESGASLQYCHAGLKGLQRDSDHYFKTDIDTSPLLEKEAHDLVQHLARFDEMVFKSYSLLEPCILLQYLFTLWHLTDRATNVLKLDLKSDRLIVVKARLMLLSATMKVLHQCLKILGLTPLETDYTIPDL